MNRDDKKQKTRENILNTAGQLFQEHGFSNVSTRQIAKESGVGVGTVFSHFKDKQALTISLFYNKIEARLSAQVQKSEQEKTGLKYFLSYAQFLYEFYEEDKDFSIALLQNALFDMQFFQQQMDVFIAQVANKLKAEMPNHSEQQRFNLAKAWFGFYSFHLLLGLSQTQFTAKHWVKNLEKECKLLLSSMG